MYELVISQDGIETVAYSGTEAEMQEWLKRKNLSHTSHGWTVVSLEPLVDGFDATKLRSDLSVKSRRVFIRAI